MSDNVSAFLNTSPSDSPEMIDLPVGKYRFQVAGYNARAVGADNKVLLTINLRPIEVIDSDGVTDDQLAYVDTVRQKYWATDKALASSNPSISLKAFLKHVLREQQTAEEVESEEYKVLLELAIGQEFVGISKINMEGRNKDEPTPVVGRFVAE